MPPIKPPHNPGRIATVDITQTHAAQAWEANQRHEGYWRSLAELAKTTAFTEAITQEFSAADPASPGALLDTPVTRRHSLKLLGASMALANMTACSRQPDEHILPYVNMPEHLVPGRPRYYATATMLGGYAQGVLVESHEGRPTKIEGNPDHPASLGACDAISQASVLSVYDPDRAQSVRYRNSIAALGDLERDLQTQRRLWDANQGQGLCFLLAASSSPSEAFAVQQLQQRWPRARWFMQESVDRRSLYAGAEMLFGQPLEAVYHFDKARVVVSLDSDFMLSQPGSLRYARDFMQARVPRMLGSQTQPARLYVLESTPSVTGGVADHRRCLPWPDIAIAAQELARGLGVVDPQQKQSAGNNATAGSGLLPSAWLNAVCADLRAHDGNIIVIPGDHQPPAVHALAHGINHALGALGKTVELIPPQANYVDLPGIPALKVAIEKQEVSHLVVLGNNPVYEAPADINFAKIYPSIPWRLHFGEYHDETGHLSTWQVPAAHALETWADARAYDGTLGVIQPLIQPLYDGLSNLQMLFLLHHGVVQDARHLLRSAWQAHGFLAANPEDFEQTWRSCLQRGFVENSAAKPVSLAPRDGWQDALGTSVGELTTAGAWDLILQFRPDPALWDGRYANNGWLQEQPRPITTLTWGGALLISPGLAEERGLKDGSVVKLTTTAGELRLPVFILPGQPDAAVTLFLGQGHQNLGSVAMGVGVNANHLRDTSQLWSMPVTLEPTGAEQQLALLQHHHNMENRDLIRAASIAEFRKNPTFAQRTTDQPDKSLYPEPWPAKRSAENAWGMVIDLSACIGCNACVTACQAENNIPVVGEDEVVRGHNMHWLRVDRYFSAKSHPTGVKASVVQEYDPALVQSLSDAPLNLFQPVPCMHCENAPCEYVCPVGATQHSADGLNEMIYQRCVGTRYCSQNCPYKVRRFNWFDYTSNTARYPNLPAQQNPDVSIRERGVMEKCTYCVQRISSVRQTAEAEHRPILDTELQTACQQTCPTRAIIFGDTANPDSEVSRLKALPLNYPLLAHLNTRPRTTYLAAVRNPNPHLSEPGGASEKNQRSKGEVPHD